MCRILPELTEQVEEPLAAANLLMKAGYQRALRPVAGAAPRRVQHHVVETGAECIVRRAQLIHRHAAVARGLFEDADLLDGALAQVAGVRLAVGVAQTSKQLQQWSRRLDQRVEAEADLFTTVGADRRRRRRVAI